MLCNSIGKMGVNPALLINADCTRVDHTFNSDGKKGKGVVPKESVSTLKQRSAKTSADSSKKDYVCIRWFPCANMNGDMGPVVLIVADENMRADDMHVREVLLTLTSRSRATGLGISTCTCLSAHHGTTSQS